MPIDSPSAQGQAEHSPRMHSGPSPRGGLLFLGSGVLVVALLGALVSPQAASWLLCALLAGAGTWRACGPTATRAAGIAVRSRLMDVLVYWALAAAIAALTLTIPYF